MVPEDLPEQRRALLAWYRAHFRDLPWRRTREPYPILVSEIMAQQTRVEVAAGYYLRFLERFPTVDSLAAAPLDEVLELWAGLGYYRRARSLHAAAVRIVRELGGRFPADRAGLLALPGVGAYTAAAVGSIAFGLPLAVVDGNVIRVIARLHALEEDPARSQGRRLIETAAQVLLDRECPGDANQALMELGARVCTPRAPGCHGDPSCPLEPWCRAAAEGRAEELPAPRVRGEPRELAAVALAILRVRGELEVLVERIPEGEWNAGLWDLPGGGIPVEHSTAEARRARAAGQELAARWDLVGSIQPAGEIVHGITHHRIRVHLFGVQAPTGWEEPPGTRWTPLAGAEQAGLCARALKAARRLREVGPDLGPGNV